MLVKTTATMNGSYTFLFATAEERAAFVKRPDIWWFHFPEEDDDWQWHRGWAWKPAHEIDASDLVRPPLPPAGAAQGAVTVDDDEEDDRW